MNINNPLKRSLYLFAFALVAFLFIGVLLDSTLASAPDLIQRLLPLVLVILPAAAGAVLAAGSFSREPRNTLLSAVSLLLNLLTALFFSLVILISG